MNILYLKAAIQSFKWLAKKINGWKIIGKESRNTEITDYNQ